MIVYLAAALLGALGNRVRGGVIAIPGGTQVARILGWGLPSAAMAWWAGVSLWVALGIGVAAFAGCVEGEYNSQSMGLKGGVGGWRAWAWMTWWGLFRVVPVAVVVAFGAAMAGRLDVAALWPLGVAALATAPIYYAVRWLPRWAMVPGLGRGTPPGYDPDPCQWAEVLHGAALMVGLVAAVRG